jgi:hypothetical protein
MTDEADGIWVTMNGRHVFIPGENINESSEVTINVPDDSEICKFDLGTGGVVDVVDKNKENQRNAIGWWKGSGFEVIQKAVKTPNDLFKPDREKGLEASKHIDNVLSKSKIEQDTTVYRGISSRTAYQIMENGAFENKGYTATSVAMGDAMGFAQHMPLKMEDSYVPGRDLQSVIMFNVPKGSSGFYFGRGRESEVLLPRNLKLKLTGVRTYTKTLNVKTITDTGRLRQQTYGPVRIYTMEMQK